MASARSERQRTGSDESLTAVSIRRIEHQAAAAVLGYPESTANHPIHCEWLQVGNSKSAQQIYGRIDNRSCGRGQRRQPGIVKIERFIHRPQGRERSLALLISK